MVEGITSISNVRFFKRKFYTQERPMSKPYSGPGSSINMITDLLICELFD